MYSKLLISALVILPLLHLCSNSSTESTSADKSASSEAALTDNDLVSYCGSNSLSENELNQDATRLLATDISNYRLKSKTVYWTMDRNQAPKTITWEEAERWFINATEKWIPSTGIEFKHIGSESEYNNADGSINSNTNLIVVHFSIRDEAAGFDLDGQWGTLAACEYPKNRTIHMYFDNDEHWTVDNVTDKDKADFYSIAMHEIGHALGIGHSTHTGAMMFPKWRKGTRGGLNGDDENAASKMYP